MTIKAVDWGLVVDVNRGGGDKGRFPRHCASFVGVGELSSICMTPQDLLGEVEYPMLLPLLKSRMEAPRNLSEFSRWIGVISRLNAGISIN